MTAVEVPAGGPLHELPVEQRQNNADALALVKARRMPAVTLGRMGFGSACDRLVATGVLRYFRDGDELWLELND